MRIPVWETPGARLDLACYVPLGAEACNADGGATHLTHDTHGLPEDLAQELGKNEKALERFLAFSDDHRQDLVEWIDRAPDESRRLHRVRMVIEVILHTSLPSAVRAQGTGPIITALSAAASALRF